MNGVRNATAPARRPDRGPTQLEAAVLDRFEPASLALLNDRLLLRRVDSKLLVPRALVPDLLSAFTADFAVVLADGARAASYETRYYDTPERAFYHTHRRGRRPRHKVRVRHYHDRDVTWLEVKTRTRYGATHKVRVERAPSDFTLHAGDLAHIERVIGPTGPLEASCRMCFPRITLVGVAREERITIDLGFAFDNGVRAGRFDGVAVVEVKQPRLDRRSPSMRTCRDLGLRRRRVSKYCAALSLLEPTLPDNVFRPVLRDLRRIDDAGPCA